MADGFWRTDVKAPLRISLMPSGRSGIPPGCGPGGPAARRAVGLAVAGLAVAGLAVAGLAVTGLAVAGLAVAGLAVAGCWPGGCWPYGC